MLLYWVYISFIWFLSKFLIEIFIFPYTSEVIILFNQKSEHLKVF